MFRKILPFVGRLVILVALCSALGQSADDAVRVTVTINPDGSKTVYQANGANHESIATTTGVDGKVRGKIIYRLDADGRYESGQVFAANGALRFKTLYKYDAAGRLTEETQIAKDDSVLNKIVYSFDAEGHQNGYAIYDGAGRLVGRVNPKPAADDHSQSKTKTRKP